MLAVAATGIKDFSLSEDGKDVTFALITKHSGDLAVTLPADSLKVLKVPAKRDTPGSNGTGAMAANDKAASVKVRGGLTVSVPKKWFVATDAQRGLVVVALDPQTATQSGFALGPKAAKELAAALMKQAGAAAASAAAKRP